MNTGHTGVMANEGPRSDKNWTRTVCGKGQKVKALGRAQGSEATCGQEWASKSLPSQSSHQADSPFGLHVPNLPPPFGPDSSHPSPCRLWHLTVAPLHGRRTTSCR